jgi:hypothetical protein
MSNTRGINDQYTTQQPAGEQDRSFQVLFVFLYSGNLSFPEGREIFWFSLIIFPADHFITE